MLLNHFSMHEVTTVKTTAIYSANQKLTAI